MPAPTLTSCNPDSGPTAGGTEVTLTGTDFVDGATVTFEGDFGSEDATDVVVVNSTTITCTTPAYAADTVDVVVTNPDEQTGTLELGYTYNGPPILNTVSPDSGPTSGGTAVTLGGVRFSTVINDVTFDGVSATSIVRVNSTTVTCVTPAHVAGPVAVVIENSDGQTDSLSPGFTYVASSGPPLMFILRRR